MDAPEIEPVEQVPPKLVSLQARRVAPDGDAGLLLAGRMSGRLERRLAGEFPVLEAFQQFLENERQRARRHLVIMTSLIAVLLLGVTILGVYLGSLLHRNVTQDVGKLQADLAAIQAETGRVRDEARAQVALVTDTAATLRRDVTNTVHAQAREIARYTEAMAAMDAKMEALEVRNEMLNQDLASVQKVMPSLTEDMGLVVNLLAELKSRPPAEIETVTAQPPAPPAASSTESAAPPAIDLVPSEPLNLALLITPPGSTAGVPWRLLIPE